MDPVPVLDGQHRSPTSSTSATQPLIVDYHNITPARFFVPWEPRIANELEAGRQQMTRLADTGGARARRLRVQPGRARPSGISLDNGGVPCSSTSPPSTAAPTAAALDRLQRGKASGGADWLFVGRLSPNKAQHDIVQAFAVYRRCYDPQARLTLVGGSSSLRYERALRASIAALGLGDSVRMPGSVSDAVLAAHYRTADVFVCLSDHEGFCVPLLEAMHHRLPIVAFAATAVPETLGERRSVPSRQGAGCGRARGVARADRGRAACPPRRCGERRVRDFDLTRTGRDLHVGHHRARSASRRESDPPVPPDARSR